jgi:hypothetical protein
VLFNLETEQIVGRERSRRACHRQLVGNVVASRRVNSTVIWLLSLSKNMSTHRSILPAILLILAAFTPATPQGSSPLLDRIVQSVRKTNPKWHFIPGFCTCPVLVRSQSAYAFGEMYYRNLTSGHRVLIYIAYVPTSAIAADWMTGLRDRNARAGWQREQYWFADEAYLWTVDHGNAYLYFRKGAVVAELSGALSDVESFAHTLAEGAR